jgi:hypothetical protein
MKSRAMLSAVLMLMILAGCAPAPQIIREVVIVTATPKPVIAVAKQPVSPGRQADEWVRLLEHEGWTEMDTGESGTRGLVYSPSMCELIRFEVSGTGAVVGMSYAVDFLSSCDGSDMADVQWAAYLALGLYDVAKWAMTVNVDGVFSGAEKFVSGPCGAETCGANMASDSMLVFHVYFD